MARFSLLIVTFIVLFAEPSFTRALWFANSHFQAGAVGLQLLGDADIAGDGYSVQLNRPTPSSFGVVLLGSPFNFSSSTSFSSNFTFEIGNGVGLVIVPSDFPSRFDEKTSSGLLDVNRLLSIEFDVDVCRIVSSRVCNVSKFSNVLKSRVNLSCWIDYRAILQRLDVRLSKLDDPKPVEPLISYRIDLGKMLKNQEVLLGLASSNRNHEQITVLHSWNYKIKDVPKWYHSIPVNPLDHSIVDEEQSRKKRGCFLSGFMFATGCGAIAALALFFVWSYMADQQKTVLDPAVSPIDFKYEKIGVLEANNREAAMK